MSKLEYKQKISNINYFDDVVTISLKRDEWNWCETWVQSMMYKGTDRVGKEWFEDLNGLVMFNISREINFSNKNYEHNIDIPFHIPRELLRMFVGSIGKIAYCFDVKPITSIIAQNILEKINKQLKEQLPSDDRWFKFGY